MNQYEEKRLPGEVVLEYSPAPKAVVLEYRQDTPLPRLSPLSQAEPAPEALPLQKTRRVKKRHTLGFILCFLLLCGAATGIHFAFQAGLIPSLEQSGSYQPPVSNGGQEAASSALATVPADKDVRMTINRSHGEVLSPQEIYARVNPATVTVFCGSRNGSGQVGTGVIFTSDGYVLTNYHVIDTGDYCTVILETGATYEARLVAGDNSCDIAVLKMIGAKDLPTVEFGDSDTLVVGDSAYAIGNPLGLNLRGTLTDGIISATSREVTAEGRTLAVMQTNAALNSGNSGGPLINQYGQVVGINTIKMMSTVTHGTVEGLGFALPSTSVIYVVNDLLTVGYSRGEPVIGITVYNALTPLPDGRQGLEILEVYPNSSAEEAGMQVGDFILTVDGQAVSNTHEVTRLRRTHAVGEQMTFTLWREGKVIEFELTLAIYEG